MEARREMLSSTRMAEPSLLMRQTYIRLGDIQGSTKGSVAFSTTPMQSVIARLEQGLIGLS